jgi:membrane protease YdiL (CAAX protease family)
MAISELDDPASVPVAPAAVAARLDWGRLAPLGYLLILALAELLTTLLVQPVGLILHGLLLLTITAHAALTVDPGRQRLLLALTLAPLIRLLSLSLPLAGLPQVYWYAIVGAPLFVAAYFAIRASGYSAARLGFGFTWRGLPLQLLFGLSGLVLGFVEYNILRPAPLAEGLSLQQILLPAGILAVFTGLLEEVVFRGLMQRAAQESLGRWGVLYVALIFAILHFGYKSPLDVAFVLVVGLSFGLMVSRTRSLLGVTLAHSLTNIALFLIVPFLVK